DEARRLADAGDLDRALAKLDQHLLASPFDAAAHLLAAFLYQASHRHIDAEGAARRALMLDRDQPMAHYLLAACLARTGRDREARRHLDKAIGLMRDSDPRAAVDPTATTSVGELRGLC